MSWFHRIASISPWETKFPIAGDTVSGLEVKGPVPNWDSIAASFINYEILPGIREVNMSDLGELTESDRVWMVSNDPRAVDCRSLAEQIKESGQIKPLIIGVGSGLPYVVEGGHRIVALDMLDRQTFPAVVVIDLDEVDIDGTEEKEQHQDELVY